MARKEVYNNGMGTFFHRLLLDKRYRMVRHLLCLCIIILFNYNGKHLFREPYDIYHQVWMDLFMILLFYVNMYVLVPKFLLRKKYSRYFIILCLQIYISYIAMVFFDRKFMAYMISPADAYNLLHQGLFMFPVFQFILAAASAAVKLFQQWITDTERINELEKITLHSELEQLKTQITPHFLFNTLNNANVLTQKDPGKASEILVRLSDILRYQLYDSSRNKVFLSSEIRFLNDLLNLEKIRRENFSFIIRKEGHTADVMLPPMLFINFVENAVKYSLDSDHASYVHVCFSIEGQKLIFVCENSISSLSREKAAASTHGIGLQNIQRRLELLFPGKHQLNISEKDNHHLIKLKLQL